MVPFSRLRRSRKLCAGLVMTLILVFVLLSYRHSVERQTEEFIIKTHNREFREKTVKRILYWDPVFPIQWEMNCIKQCPVKCVVTSDKNTIQDSDAVSYQLTELWPDNWKIDTREIVRFPTYRRSHQVWIVMNLEPPGNLFGDPSVFNGMFNWTMWYRRDSTVFNPYDRCAILNTTERTQNTNALDKRNFHKEKEMEIAGKISNCNDFAYRYKTIQRLQNFMKIDMFGKCYNNTCGDPLAHSSCDGTIRKYKFYLAFENGNCKDYVTEKYWSALHREQIPIVNWNHVDISILVPNSYINIHDFKDMQTLADYIKKVSLNETLYNSYFEWKKWYKKEPFHCMSCSICEALHDSTMPAQVITDFDAWVRNDTCPKVGVFNNWVKNTRADLFWKFGI